MGRDLSEVVTEEVQQVAGGHEELAMSIRATPEKRRRMQPLRTVYSRRTRAKRGFVLLPRRWVVERSFVEAAPPDARSGIHPIERFK